MAQTLVYIHPRSDETVYCHSNLAGVQIGVAHIQSTEVADLRHLARAFDQAADRLGMARLAADVAAAVAEEPSDASR